MKTRDGVETLEPVGDGDGVCAIAVELLLCDTIDLSGVPSNARAKYVAQKVHSLAPFPDADFHSEYVEDQAIVWIWDRNPVAPMSARTVPEHLILRAPEGRGWRAAERRVREVWFLECWNGDELAACRRYADRPTDDDRQAFLRARSANETLEWGSATGDYSPRVRGTVEPLSLAWCKRPIGVAAILAIVAGAALLVAGGRYVGWSASVLAKERSLDQALGELEPVLSLRERAVQLDASGAAIEAWLRRPSVLAVAADFEAAAGGLYHELLEWSFDEGRVRAELRSPDDRTRELLEALEASDRFEGVEVKPGDQSDVAVVEATVARSDGP